MSTDALLDELVRASQTQTALLRQIAGGISSVGGAGGAGGGEGPDKEGIFKRGLAVLSTAAVDTAKSVTTLGRTAFDSVLSMSSVANALTGLPGPLGTLASIAGIAANAIEGVAKSYNQLTSSGINFGGSLTNMKLAASGAYMSLDQFASMLSANSATLAKMGGTVDEGAESFAKVSNVLNKSPAGDALRSLGYTSEQVNSGLLNYISITGGRNKEELKTVEGQRQLAASAAAYMTQLDGLAQLTGESRSELEKKIKADMEEASFQAFMATQSKEDQEAITATMANARAKYGDAGVDMARAAAMGVAVQGEAGQKLAALSGETNTSIINEIAIRKRGGNNLLELQKNDAAGQAATQRNLMQFAGAVGTYGGALKGIPEAVKGAAAATQAGVKSEEDHLKRLQSIQANQENVKNSEAAAVAKAQTYFNELGQQIMVKLMPVFAFVIGVTTKLATALSNVLGPIIEFGSKAIGSLIQPFMKFWDVLSSAVLGLDWVGIGNSANKILNVLSTFLNTLVSAVIGLDWVGIGNSANKILNVLSKFWNNLSSAVLGVDWAGIGDAAKKTFDMLWSSIKEVFQPIFDRGVILFETISNDLGPVFQDFGEIFKLIFARIQDVIGILKTYVWPIIQPIAEGIMDSMIPLWNAFKSIIKSIKFILSGDFSSAGKMLESTIGSLWDSLKMLFKGLMEAAKKLLSPTSWFESSKPEEPAQSTPKPVEPAKVTSEPTKSTEKPPAATPTPPVATAKPPENPKPKTETTTAKPPVATPTPPVATAKSPENPTPKTETTTAKTAAAAAPTPPVATAKPPVATPTPPVATAKPPENPTPKTETTNTKTAAAAAPEPATKASAPKPESVFGELQTLNKQTADILKVMREVAEYAKRNVDATRSLNKNLFPT
jgi:gamma-glutamylcyclotransferase (GGCT)/AIG2-like uncharacterized protein YtfP